MTRTVTIFLLACLSACLFAGPAAAQQPPDLPPSVVGAGPTFEPAGSRAADAAAADAHVGDPVTVEEAREVLVGLERAHAEEDAQAAAALHGVALRRLARFRLQKLFDERNFLELENRLVGHRSLPDGRRELDVVIVLRSRSVEENTDRRAKSRWTYVLARNEAGDVVIVEGRKGGRRMLSGIPTFRPQDWRIRVELEPRPTVLNTPSGVARVEARVEVRNVADDAVSMLGFALHPFASDVVARWDAPGVTAATLELDRDEGAGDTFWAELPAPIDPGDVATLSVDHVIDLVGRSPHSQLGEGSGHLFSESAWHPLFGAPRHDRPQSAPHDLTVVAPTAMSVVAPGTLASLEELPDGRRAWRFFSRLPGEELAVVAAPLLPEEVDVGSGVVAEVWRSPRPDGTPRGAPPRLIGLVEDSLAWMSDLLGPPPVDHVTFVELPEAEGKVLRAAPAFFATDRLDPGEPDPRVLKQAERHFFLAHHLAHLWLVESLEARGPGAIALTEALSDHVAVAWIEDEVTKSLPPRWRTDVLQELVMTADVDRPVAVDVDHLPFSRTFGRGKAWLALDHYRRFAGEERWREGLRTYWDAARGRTVELPALLRALAGEDPRLKEFVGTWFLGRGVANPKVVDVRWTEADDPEEAGAPGVGEVEIANDGVGPIAFRARVRVDARWHEEIVELGPGGVGLLRLPAASRPAGVVLDPDRTTWQVVFDDDEWPFPRPVTREELSSPPQLDPEKIERMMGGRMPDDLPGGERRRRP